MKSAYIIKRKSHGPLQMTSLAANYKIIDNYLPHDEFQLIQDTMLGAGFAWFYNKFVDYDPIYAHNIDDYQNNFQFIHKFYANYTPSSEYIHVLNPILKKLDPAALIRIKANLSTGTANRISHNYHTDHPQIQCTTAIFYVNSNDGITIFQDESEVASIANRLLIFDSQLMHKGTTCTDQKVRCLINFNYYSKLSK